MKSQKKLIRFFAVLFVLLLVVFICHISFKQFIKEPVFSNKIIESYLLNFFLGSVSYWVLVLSSRKYVTSLGFIFMYTSFAKFVVFFVVFKPFYSANGEVDLGEFLTLMLPYAFTLTVEIYSMSKILKN